MKKCTLLLLMLMAANLMSIEIIHDHGMKKNYSYTYFSGLPRTGLTAELEKKGEIIKYSWKGFRFDKWLEANGFTDFTGIRFESPDRYMVTLTRYEFEQNECWMVFEQNGEKLDQNTFRVVFPALRQMYWIAGMNRIVLENFSPLKMPRELIFMERAMAKQQLIQEPKPFVKIQGYYLEELIKSLGNPESAHIVMQSADDLKIRLEYPLHLSGAILELGPEGNYNLKSPQIPGGMWLNDIAYIQIGEKAFIRERYLHKLVELNKSLSWHLQLPFKLLVIEPEGRRSVQMADLLEGKALTEKSTGFEIIPQ